MVSAQSDSIQVVPQSGQRPLFVHEASQRIPVSDHLVRQATIPASRMFFIKRSLTDYLRTHPGSEAFDASQGDGGASLDGVPPAILEEAARLVRDRGTAYDLPAGTEAFRRAVIEEYWALDADHDVVPENVIATVGGRDGLQKAYQAMLALGHGRQGDVLLVDRVPWISYNWGPYGVGANVLLAPGVEDRSWALTPAGIAESVAYAARHGRRVAGMVITSPDNPTGNTLPIQEQVELARVALRAGVGFVLLDWMYHYVSDADPIDLNRFLRQFSKDERARLIVLDGITKSLGASNVRNAHLIASREVAAFINGRASHGVIPPFHGQAVAIAAYRQEFWKAAEPIVAPTNASRGVLREVLTQASFRFILGQGYYAFIHMEPWLEAAGWTNTEPLGRYLAEQWGLAVVPGLYFSDAGARWIRFSYASPPDVTRGALQRLIQALGFLLDQPRNAIS